MSGDGLMQASVSLDAASRLGADAILAKPFGAPALRKLVEQLLTPASF
jgi:hypothetical protein